MRDPDWASLIESQLALAAIPPALLQRIHLSLRREK